MAEKQPREINRHPEKVSPLTLTLSETAQRGVLRGFKSSLTSLTTAESNGVYKDAPEILAELAELRRVTTTLAKNVGEEFSPSFALSMGLIDSLPPGLLEQVATTESNDWSFEHRAKARYFLNKKTPEANP
jgi:hypothetical protein